MTIYGIVENNGFDGYSFENKMYRSFKKAEDKCKELDKKKAKKENMTVEELFLSDENYEIIEFELI